MEGEGIVSRQGGKFTKRKQVFARFPKDYTTYVEPFVGGGSIFLDAPIVPKMIAGDTDTRLIHVFQDLKTLDVPMVQSFNFNLPFTKEHWERADKYARSKKKGTARFIANLLIRKFSFSGTAKSFLYAKSMDQSNYNNLKIQRTLPLGGYHYWHYENASGQYTYARELVWMVYLNTMPPNEAETEFLYQKMRIRPTKGTVVFFPAGMTHVHRGLTVYSEPKYIATGWYYKMQDF
jgi:hypothetical protein